MKRRTFLKLGLAAGTSTALIGFWLIRYTRLSAENVIEKIVRHYIGDENLVKGAAARFAKDFSPQYWTGNRHKIGFSLSLYFNKLWRDLLHDSIGISFDEYERKIITIFIQSSDISEKPNGLKSPIDYVGLTMEVACNPFARLRA